MDDTQHNDVQPFLLTTGRPVTSLTTFSSPIDEYRVAFEIDSDEYEIETSLGDKASYADAVAQAIKIENKIKKFYEDAAEQSKSLMADVPRIFVRIARKRDERIAKLLCFK